MSTPDHFDFNVTLQWCGYIVKRTRECGGSQDMSNPMYCVSKGMINPIPGAMFFSSPEQAKKAIAALRLAIQLVPAPDYNDNSESARRLRAEQGAAYHMFMELART